MHTKKKFRTGFLSSPWRFSGLYCGAKQGLNYDDWLNDRKTIDAVVRNLEVIGEAAANVPESVQARFVDIPWFKM